MQRRAFLEQAICALLGAAVAGCADGAEPALQLPALPGDPSRWLNSGPLGAALAANFADS